MTAYCSGMADRIAGLLFEYATLIVPLTIAASLGAIVFLARRWPARAWRRVGAGALALLLVGGAGGAGARRARRHRLPGAADHGDRRRRRPRARHLHRPAVV